jgi:hypothetical protein
MKKFLGMLCSLLALGGSTRATTVVRDYQPARHDRFYTGTDKAFVGDPYSFSGVGLSSDGRWATLVSDNFFISATHYHPTNGATVTFWETNLSLGPSHTYTVAGGQQIGSTDLWVGWLNTAADADLARYAVLDLALPADYLNRVLYNYGVSHRVGRNVGDSISLLSIAVSTGQTLWFDYDNSDVPSVGGDETWLQSGDSGAPTFTVFDGQLTLLGIHWAIAVTPTTNSIDTLVPWYIENINAVLDDQSQSLQVIPEPIPGRFGSAGIGIRDSPLPGAS